MSKHLQQFANPQAIVKHIEDESTGTAPEDPYRARVEALMASLLTEEGDVGDVDDIADAEHIRQTSAGLALETAARQTGFILGFEYLRDLMKAGGTSQDGKPIGSPSTPRPEMLSQRESILLTVDERDAIGVATERAKAMLTLVLVTLNEEDVTIEGGSGDADRTGAVLTACNILCEALNDVDDTFHAADERQAASDPR